MATRPTPRGIFPPADTDAAGLLRRLREFALVASGQATDARLDSMVTLRMLQDSGMVTIGARYLAGAPGAGPGTGGDPVISPADTVDLTAPPTPTGFVATAGITNILLETDPPRYRQGHGHARTRVYAAPVTGGPLPTFADAVLYVDFPGNIDAAPFDPASSLRLWATWVSADGVESAPAGGTNGIAATTGLIDNAKISSLSAAKILAGALAVGQYIQSADYAAGVTGWRIQTLAGGGAFMEINGGATIGGAAILADQIRSTNFTLGLQGWRLKSDGTAQIGGMSVTLTGLQSNNYVAGTSGFRLTFDGQILTKNFTVNAAGNATFSGALSAATGTFAGALSAATGTFAGALSAATGTFAGSLSAASGTFAGSLTAQVVDTTNIVGAAVSTNYVASGTHTASLSVTAPAGSSSLIILGDPGWVSSGGGEASDPVNYADQLTLVINGTTVLDKAGFGMYSIVNPSGSYTITATRAVVTGPMRLAALLTKR